MATSSSYTAFTAGLALGCLGAVTCLHLRETRQPLATQLVQAPSPAAAQLPLSLDDDIVGEQLTRNVQFFGRPGQERVCGAFVVVVGLGGVGSHAAAMLLRSGVGRLRLIDFDQVTLSSLNRHAVATRADVGTPKALAMQRHFALIAPETPVDARVAMYTEAAEDELLAGEPDCVLDCIDNIDTKVALLAACARRGLRVLTVAGAGGKADPTRLHVAPLAESVRDPLARAVRHKLRRALGGASSAGPPCLFSTEAPRCGLVTPDVPGVELAELQQQPGFRVRTIPVLGTTPSAFGCAAAAWALCLLAGQPLHGRPPCDAPPEAVEQQLARLCEREALLCGSLAGLEVDAADCAYVMAELWGCRSARHGLPGDPATAAAAERPGAGRHASFRSTRDLLLTRWNAALPAAVDNLVLLTFDEADAHDAAGVAAVRAAEPEFAARVEAALDRAARDHGLVRRV